MNFVDAAVTQSGDEIRLVAPGLSLPPPTRFRDLLQQYTGKTVIAGIRPEAIHDHAYQPFGATTTKVEATIDVTELMGSEIIAYVLVGTQTLVARLDPRSQARPGQPITLAFETERMHLFDPESTLALGLSPEEPVTTATAVSAKSPGS